MKEIVELYTRLVIATFGFIGPSFSLLMLLFYSAIENAQSRSKVQTRMVQYLIDDNYDDKKMSELGTLLKRLKKEVRQLRPEYQILRLMTGLFTAIFFIGLYYFLRAEIFLTDGRCLKEGALFFSCIGFLFSLKVLWELFCIIIKAKEEGQKIKREKQDESNADFLMAYDK